MADNYVDDSIVDTTNTGLTSACAGTRVLVFAKGDTRRTVRRIYLLPGRSASWVVRLLCPKDGGIQADVL